MNRILVIVGVVLGLGAIGLTAAHADNTGYSTWCTDGAQSGETNVPAPFVGLSYETPPGGTGPSWVAACYSTTPNGSSSPETAGGFVRVWNPLSAGKLHTECLGDRTTSQTAAVDCNIVVTPTDPSAAPGTTATGSAKVGATGPVNVGQTGAEVNPTTTTNTPLSGAAGTGGSLGTGTGTCTWINGSRDCPGALTVGGVTVNEGDASVGPHTAPGGCLTVGGGCVTSVPSGVGVDAFEGDPTNDTLTVEVLGTRVSRDLGDCYVGVNAPSSC